MSLNSNIHSGLIVTTKQKTAGISALAWLAQIIDIQAVQNTNTRMELSKYNQKDIYAGL